VAAMSVVATSIVAGTTAAGAATPACPLSLTAGSPITPAGGHAVVICSGKVRSFDGTPLAVDVSLPLTKYSDGDSDDSLGRPLVGFIHGWGGSKTDWESSTLAGNNGDQYHWNNAWFASHGMVVLNYTTRGFHTSCGKDSGSNYIYSSDSTCSDTTGEKSWTHLADRRWEIHDFQYLAGLLVDAKLGINPRQIVATGGSYGGGQSWDLALSQDQVVASSSTDPAHPTLSPWTSPKHVALHLAAAIPLYPWTDLEDALVSNGTASDGYHGAPADGTHGTPYGIEKQSYVAGLYADGQASAQYAAPNADPTADLSTWYAGITAGEPYSANPSATTAAQQVGGAFRSPYAMPVPAPAHQVPVFVIQGFTDPLFNALQALDMINHLHKTQPNYPVWSFLGDLGHSYADNPTDIWHQAHNASNAWLTTLLDNHTPTQPRFTADTTRCVSGQTLHAFSGPSFAKFATTSLTMSSAASQQTAYSAGDAANIEGKNSDPIANSGCRSMAASQSDPNQATYSLSLTKPYVLVGAPVVHVTAAVLGSSIEVAARLWDVDASGQQTLVARTVYRLEEGTAGMATVPLAFELWPNAWQLQAGHSIKLELNQNDAPVWRPDNQSSSITFSNLKLSLPVVPGT